MYQQFFTGMKLAQLAHIKLSANLRLRQRAVPQPTGNPMAHNLEVVEVLNRMKTLFAQVRAKGMNDSNIVGLIKNVL